MKSSTNQVPFSHVNANQITWISSSHLVLALLHVCFGTLITFFQTFHILLQQNFV